MKHPAKLSAIILAAGSSKRFGDMDKLLENLGSKPVILHSVDIISTLDEVDEIIIATSDEILPALQNLLINYPKVRFIKGGRIRQESVYNALQEIENPEFVLIHDGARPLVKKSDIENCLTDAKLRGAAILAVKTVDTIKKVDENKKIIETLNRDFLYNVQTPQIFRYDLILSAHKILEGKNFSDDAGMLEKQGCDVFITEGSYSNIKITTKNDLLIAEQILSERLIKE